MKKLIFKNMANLVVLVRSALIFLVIYLLNYNSLPSRLTGLIFLVVVTVLDWADGYIARVYKIESMLGGLLDTLGDRITENLLFIFFAYVHIIPLFVPLIFVTRSLLADFVRYQYLSNGISTFLIHKSKLGILLVASKSSRALYLISKMIIFFLAGLVLVMESVMADYHLDLQVFLDSMRQVIFYGSIYVVLFSTVRFILLIYDSRFILKENFFK